MIMNTIFWQILFLISMNEWTRTEALQVDHHSNEEIRENNFLFDVLRRVENIETTNDHITEENKRLRDDINTLKMHISTMKADHESIVEVLQTQISELRSELSDKNNGGNEANDKVSNKNEDSSVSLANELPLIPPIKAIKQRKPLKDKEAMENEKRRELSVLKSGERLALRSENEENIAFFATVGNHHIQHAGTNQTIIFDDVITNHGNGYSKFAGDFRAPVAGTYVFSVTLMAYAANSGHYRFVKNGKGLANIYVQGHESAYATSSLTTVIDLQLGDDVSIKNIDPDKYLHGYAYSSFSGFLLQQNFANPAIVGK